MPRLIRFLRGAVLLAALVSPGCQESGVDPSPSPGTLRVVFTANPNDTSIVIQNDTSRFSRWDEFNLFTSQGRVYRGENYASIYVDPSIARIPGDTVNILAREWLNGTPISTLDTTTITTANSRYRKYVIFESYVPPGEYDRLQMSLNAKEMRIYIPKVYQNPVQLPEGVSPIIDFRQDFTVQEGGVMELEIQISPFQSLSRYRDSFLFDRKVAVVRMENK